MKVETGCIQLTSYEYQLLYLLANDTKSTTRVTMGIGRMSTVHLDYGSKCMAHMCVATAYFNFDLADNYMKTLIKYYLSYLGVNIHIIKGICGST